MKTGKFIVKDPSAYEIGASVFFKAGNTSEAKRVHIVITDRDSHSITFRRGNIFDRIKLRMKGLYEKAK